MRPRQQWCRMHKPLCTSFKLTCSLITITLEIGKTNQVHMSQFTKESSIDDMHVPCKSAEIHVSSAWSLLLLLVLLASVFTSSTADHCRWHGGSHVLRQQADSAFTNDKELAGLELDDTSDGTLSLWMKLKQEKWLENITNIQIQSTHINGSTERLECKVAIDPFRDFKGKPYID